MGVPRNHPSMGTPISFESDKSIHTDLQRLPPQITSHLEVSFDALLKIHLLVCGLAGSKMIQVVDATNKNCWPPGKCSSTMALKLACT